MTWNLNFDLLITASLAVAGFFAKYLNDLRLDKAEAEIKLISDQIQFLYGPLSALAAANEAAWNAFTGKYFPGNPTALGKGPWDDLELGVWRQWMTEIFMPLNRSMVDVILKNAHLIDGAEFPKPFSELISYVKTYEIVVGDWAKGNLKEHSALTNYPVDINQYARDKFKKIKGRQAKLLS